MFAVTHVPVRSIATTALVLAFALPACAGSSRGQFNPANTRTAEMEGQPTPTTIAADLELRAELPQGPAQAPIYVQVPTDTTLDPDRASKVAAQLGITGEVSSYVGEGGETVFDVSDGRRQIFVFSDSPLVFTYSANGEPVTGPPATLYSFEERARSAIEFLQAHHLLGFDFMVEPATGSNFDDFSVRVATLLPSGKLYENDSQNPRIWVVVDETASVWHVVYHTLNLRPLGEYPLLPAAAVWEDLAGSPPLYGVSYRIVDEVTGQTLSTGGSIPLPGETEEAVVLPLERAAVEQGELVYFAFDFRGHSVNAFPADSPVRIVQPMWRFAGHLQNGHEFELLARAMEHGVLQDALEAP